MTTSATVLAIDAGNSRIKWGWADDSGWLRYAGLDTANAQAIADAWQGLPAPDSIIISNVAGDGVRQAMARALEHLGAPVVWACGREQQCGVKSGYADPALLGSDRWAGVIAAWRRYGRACVVVNAGTTITVDALSHEGVFLGGVIMPGLDLMRTSLARGTAQLKMQEGVFCYFPDNTADAILSGALNAAAGTIDRAHAYMAQSAQAGALVVLSGGAAALIAPRLNLELELVDHLVLEGLLEMARENPGK